MILVIDFGSQYTQLIARRIRELNVFSLIIPHYKLDYFDENEYNIEGIILSGGPASTLDKDAPNPLSLDKYLEKYPTLAICYSAQLIIKKINSNYINKSNNREFGKKIINIINDNHIFANLPNKLEVWMSHGDTITQLPSDFKKLAETDNIAAYRYNEIYGLTFHPEVTHTVYGKIILQNFIKNICFCKESWITKNFIEQSIININNTIGKNEKVILALSGGVDSTTCAILLNKAIGDRLLCIFVNNGLLRYNEYDEVLSLYKNMGLNILGRDVSDKFYEKLVGIIDPEVKRKIIGKIFLDTFREECTHINWLAQGTIYPDIIESSGIKSHHNVGGLPKDSNFKIIEPLSMLFKDEVRKVASELGIPFEIINRHPFPGPGLAIRILGEVTAEKVKILQLADYIYISKLKEYGLYDKIWQAGAIFLPIKSVGVMGDSRTYENVIALRAVISVDGMTASCYEIPYDVLKEISDEIINKVEGINRVVYDISSKPPATIEWE